MRGGVAGAARAWGRRAKPHLRANPNPKRARAAAPLRSLSSAPQALWSPDPAKAASTQMARFAREVAPLYGFENQAGPGRDAAGLAAEYDALWRWSIADVPAFHAALWDFLDVRASTPYEDPLFDPRSPALQPPGPNAGAKGLLQTFAAAEFYPGAKLNFAENVLRFADDAYATMPAALQKPAIVAYGEARRLKDPRVVTYGQLRNRVRALAEHLRDVVGVKPGDSVVGYMPHTPEAMVAALATVAVGGVYASCSPDFGEKGALDRFGQVRPKVLFTVPRYYYKGRDICLRERVGNILAAEPMKSVEAAVLFEYDEEGPTTDWGPLFTPAADVVRDYEFVGKLRYEQVGVSHPVYTMFSSGTTGLPKCMQQGFGVFMTHLKEHRLHHDIRADDVYFQYTTTGWMMWNLKLSALATGATLVTYEGDPMTALGAGGEAAPNPAQLWDVCEHSGTTVFGTSARYLSATAAAGVAPKATHNLRSLRMVMSTGSPASENIFRYVASELKDGGGLQYCSVSGGTDLNGCFACGSPLLPVRDGELQCRALGMDVAILDDGGGELPPGEKGELCCRQPFASQPLRFLNDVGGAKYFRSYFEDIPGVWAHGDYATVTEAGGVVIYGRSDATLNPGGIRIGTADIYAVVEKDLAAEVEDSIVVGRPVALSDGTPDVEVTMFVKMKPGLALDDALVKKIKDAVRANASPRHAPKWVIAAPDIPLTTNGKKVEIAVRKAITGEEVKNKSSLANPESLDFFYGVEFEE